MFSLYNTSQLSFAIYPNFWIKGIPFPFLSRDDFLFIVRRVRVTNRNHVVELRDGVGSTPEVWFDAAPRTSSEYYLATAAVPLPSNNQNRIAVTWLTPVYCNKITRYHSAHDWNLTWFPIDQRRYLQKIIVK